MPTQSEILAAKYGGQAAVSAEGPSQSEALAAKYGGQTEDSSALAAKYGGMKIDPNTIEGLQALAHRSPHDIGAEADAIANPPRQLSMLQRMGAALSSLSPIEAIMRTNEQAGGKPGFGRFGSFLDNYDASVGERLTEAVTGNERPGENRGMGELMKRDNVLQGSHPHEQFARFAVGLGGDILTDPSTVLGGPLVKGAAQGVRAGTGAAVRGIGKLPLVGEGAEAAIRTGADELSAGVGRLFNFGHGTSEGVANTVLEAGSRKAAAKEGLIKTNTETFGALTAEQQAEYAAKKLAGKRAELAARQEAEAFQKVESAKVLKGAETDVSGRAMGLELAEDTMRPTAAADARIGLAHEASNKVLAQQATIDATEAQMRAEGKVAARAAAKSDDPVVQAVIDSQRERTATFGKAAGIKDTYEEYFPSLSVDRLKKFAEGTQSLRQSAQGYLKQFRDRIDDAKMLKNPAEAHTRREFEMVKDAINANVVDDVIRSVGKPVNAFKNADEARSAGYEMMQSKGQFGKPLGYVKKADKDFLDESFSTELGAIDKIAKYTGFDAATSLFKRSVTSLWPGFHARNWVSGNVQGYERVGAEILDPRNINDGRRLAWAQAHPKELDTGLKGAQNTIEVGGKQQPFNTVLGHFERRFGIDSTYVKDIANATGKENFGRATSVDKVIGKVTGKKTSTGMSMNPLSADAPHFRLGRAVGSFIEQQQKATTYITALRQGKTIEQALTDAAAAGFDYRALTKTESTILRRLLPFYSFTRKNAALQLKTLGENPQRINNIMKVFDNLGEQAGEDERRTLPGYLQDSFAVKLKDTAKGEKQYVSGFGTPVEEFAGQFNKNPVFKMLSQVNPVLKAPLEIQLGVDSFRQRDLKSVYDAREYSFLHPKLKEMLDIKEVHKPVWNKDPKTGKLKQTGTRIQYVVDSDKLLVLRSLFTSRGATVLDTIFDGDMEGFAKWAKLGTGIKSQVVDAELFKATEDKRKKRELEDLNKKYADEREGYDSLYTFQRAALSKKKKKP